MDIAESSQPEMVAKSTDETISNGQNSNDREIFAEQVHKLLDGLHPICTRDNRIIAIVDDPRLASPVVFAHGGLYPCSEMLVRLLRKFKSEIVSSLEI